MPIKKHVYKGLQRCIIYAYPDKSLRPSMRNSEFPSALTCKYCELFRTLFRVGIKPGFYHKAQPGGFTGFMRAGFWARLYVGFINLKFYH